jgi:hypothetical protein
MHNGNNQNKVTIYEFSDGIKYDYHNGELFSKGFELGFMNSTINSIPVDVEIAIKNDYFKVQCSPLNPAFVGRVIGGISQSWSVIAVVSKIRDDRGRTFEINRYFIAEGEDSLWKIIDYLENFNKNKGQYPIFDPQKKLQKPVTYSLKNYDSPQFNIPPELNNYLVTNKGLIEPNIQYDLQQINYLAKSVANNPSYAWAYNVSYLEKPSSFNIIVTRDDLAYQSIQSINSSLNNTKRLPIPVIYSFDENGVKTAVKELISGAVIPRHLQTISTAIENTDITSDAWDGIFNSERANRAITENISNERMANLLTLRAMILPEMLTELLLWLELKGNEKYWDKCLQFCQQFYSYLTVNARGIINENFEDGVYFLLEDLLKGKIKANRVAKLLNSKDNIWSNLRHKLIKNIQNDLELIGNFPVNFDVNNLNCGQEIWQKLIEDRQNYKTLPWRDLIIRNPQKEYGRIDYYQPLTELFYTLKISGNLAAYFSQVSRGEVDVSKKVFKSYFQQNNNDNNNNSGCLYNLILYRKRSLPEQVVKRIDDQLKQEIPLGLVLLLFLFPLFIGVVFGEVAKPFTNISLFISKLFTPKEDLERFENTKKSIYLLVNSGGSKAVFGEQEYQQKALKKIKEILGNANLDNNVILSEGKSEKNKKKEWITAIYEYQEKNTLSTKDGIVDQGGGTFKYLTVDLLFEDTRTAINNLIREVEVDTKVKNKYSQDTNTEIKKKLKEVLEVKDHLNISEAIDEQNKDSYQPEKYNLMKAIEKYQYSNNISPASGVIKQDDKTYTKLKDDLMKKLTGNLRESTQSQSSSSQGNPRT